ncbi:hypothetical protein SEES004_15286, partial [Salmonella enterica subsp. enterica serovar Senftenberg str. 361154004]
FRGREIVLADVFPAPAGINRTVFTPPHLVTRVPRASGDKPQEQAQT